MGGTFERMNFWSVGVWRLLQIGFSKYATLFTNSFQISSFSYNPKVFLNFHDYEYQNLGFFIDLQLSLQNHCPLELSIQIYNVTDFLSQKNFEIGFFLFELVRLPR